MNTTENYKIIAQFLKLSKNLHLVEHPITGKYVDYEYLNFDSDYSVLMELVENIESLKTPITNNINLIGQFEEYEVHIEGKNVVIYAHGEVTKDICHIKKETKKEAIFIACLEFIKWYSQ